jgi:uncharacterized protein with GYD domain
MATYISLLKFTQKGAETIKEGPKRLDAAKQRFIPPCGRGRGNPRYGRW